MSFISRKKNLIVSFVIGFFFSLGLFGISLNFLNCLAVAKKVLSRIHTLNGTTVEVSPYSITDEFQAKDRSGNQVRPTTEPFKLPCVLSRIKHH